MKSSKSFFMILAAAAFALAPVTVNSQTDLNETDAEYPWRVASVATEQVPTPPRMGLHNVRTPVQPQEIEAVPEPQDYSFDQVPSAPDSSVYQSVVNEPDLSVPSNANNPSIDYCARDCRQHLTCNVGCPKKLFRNSIAGFDIGGFTQFGYHNREILPFNNRQRKFNLHQVWLHADKTEYLSNGLGLRWRVDGVYGLDGQEFQAFGNAPTGTPDSWDNDWDHGAFGSAIPQAFVEFLTGDWNVRFGKFLSPIGYEAAPSTENFFYSRTYTRAYTEPFSHSGVLASRQNGNSTQLFGVTAGWDSAFESNDNGFNVLVGRKVSLSPNVQLTTTSSLGDTGYLGSGTLSSFVAEVQLASNVQYVAQVDYLNVQQVDEYSLINSLFFCQSECFAFGTRLEWWNSNRFAPSDSASTYDFTVGANYRPHSNFVIRPEVRWDWGRYAVDNGEVIFGLDAIMTF